MQLTAHKSNSFRLTNEKCSAATNLLGIMNELHTQPEHVKTCYRRHLDPFHSRAINNVIKKEEHSLLFFIYNSANT